MTPLFCFNQFGANLGMYVGGTLNWESTFIKWISMQVCGLLQWLMIVGEDLAHSREWHPSAGGPGWYRKQATESKPLSSIPPCPLHQFLNPSSYLELLPWIHGIVSWNKSSPSCSWLWYFITAIENKLRQSPTGLSYLDTTPKEN